MSWIEVLQGSATWLPFIAIDEGTGTPRTGITFAQVDCFYKKSSQTTFSAKILAAPSFRENGSGVYEILFSTGELDTLGSFIYLVNSNAGLPAPAIRQAIGQADVVTSSSYTPGTITLSTNILTGNLVDLQGNPLVNASISARIISAPGILGTSPNRGGVSDDIVSAHTDSGGFFALEVVQGAVVDIVIPKINYRRTLTVPSNATDNLFAIP